MIIQTPELDLNYIQNPSELKQLEEGLKNQTLIALDTETYALTEQYGEKASALDPHTSLIRLVQVAWTGGIAQIVDVKKLGIENCSGLIRALMNPGLTKVLHNKKFDLKQFRSTFGVWIPSCMCTMLMMKELAIVGGYKASQNRGHSYKSLIRDFCQLHLSKLEGGSDWSKDELTESQLEYAALDVAAPRVRGGSLILEAYQHLLDGIKACSSLSSIELGPRIEGWDFQKLHLNDQRAADVLAKVEFSGIPVNSQMLKAFQEAAKEQMNRSLVQVCKDLDLMYNEVPVAVTSPTLDGELVWESEVIVPLVTSRLINNPKALVGKVNEKLKETIKEPLEDLKSESLEHILKQLQEESENSDSSDSEELEDIRDINFGTAIVDNLLTYKTLAKIVGTDYHNMINPKTGRIHAPINEIGTGTSRMSSGGSGAFNVQQMSNVSIPIKAINPYGLEGVFPMEASVRHTLSPEEGLLWLSIDYKSQEPYTAGSLSKCQAILDAALAEKYNPYLEAADGTKYKNPLGDLHLRAAMSMHPELREAPPEKVAELGNEKLPNGGTRRKNGKILNLGLTYGMQAKNAAVKIGCPENKAQRLIDQYFAEFWELKNFLDTMATWGQECKFIVNAMGRPLFTSETNAKGYADRGSAGRKAANGSIQSICAEMTRLALVIVDELFQELNQKYPELPNGEIGPPVHDELNFYIPGKIQVEALPKGTSGKYVFNASKLNPEDERDRVTLEYIQAAQFAMEEAERQILSPLSGLDFPSKAEVEIHRYWKH